MEPPKVFGLVPLTFELCILSLSKIVLKLVSGFRRSDYLQSNSGKQLLVTASVFLKSVV